MSEGARERLAFAADLPLPDALATYRRIAAHFGWAKVGLSLFVEHGPAAVRAFADLGAKVFLDLKLHDIPNTVELAAERAASLGVGLLTVHAQGGAAMLAAAARGAAEGAKASGLPRPRVLAVTVLTSLDAQALASLGVAASPAEQVHRLAKLALESGADGLVSSPSEVGALRSALGEGAYLCTPGIRPKGAGKGDQARVETPERAIRDGADLLVVGRPVYDSPDPGEAARAIAAEVTAAMQ